MTWCGGTNSRVEGQNRGRLGEKGCGEELGQGEDTGYEQDGYTSKLSITEVKGKTGNLERDGLGKG